MKRPAKPGFWLVARRECRWLFHDRTALILIFGVPLFAFLVLSAVFSQPVIRGLGTVVVDADRSETSRAFIEEVATAPGLKIVERPGDLAEAARAVRAGDAIAAIYIPANFERDLKAQRRPQVVAFHNQQFLTAAGIASQGLGDSLAAAVTKAAPIRATAPAASRSGSLVPETIALVNPQRNYAQFLLRALLPMVIHVVITIAAGYSVGSEFRRRSMRSWLACAGGNPIVALAGKMAPLFAIFVVIMLSVVLILEGWFQIPFKGNVAMMIAAGMLLIVGYMALGALLQLLVRDLATGLGLAGLIVSPAFGYAGVGFPTLGMNAFAEGWSTILPLRWYMAVLLGQAARGLPPHQSAHAFAMLAALAVGLSLLALFRLGAIIRKPSREKEVAPARSITEAPRGLGQAFATEWRRVLATRGAFALLVLAPLIYGAYYPQPYLTQILRKVPIVVVDNDLSELSRALVQTLDASGAVRVAANVATLAEAHDVIQRGEAFAAVGIPTGTERDVLKGNKAHIPVYADATYLFIFRSTASAIAVAINTLSSDIALAGARRDGSLARTTLASVSPANVLLQPIFNPVGGYANYIVPAAFVLILQQTLLIGAAMMTVGTTLHGSAFTNVLGRGVAHLTLYLPVLALYLIVLPRFYGFSALGDPLQLAVLASLFVLATSFMGQMAGAWFKNPETPTLIFLATSLPQFFLTGFSWPREAIPDAVLAAGRIFPADPAIDGLVRINQLGARLWEVGHDWRDLAILTVVYLLLAVISAYFLRRDHVKA
ncbi:ABC transporter permease [Taklimakanibacter albus]|uniref:ABC transporter permease n=1 Tax=Taklimakanibacter albus TaxID=2800327 RepID=A0ACC5R8E2_9HYPH|nr:ABC transporter permease [Aestuariivirga sp. YIM B02566]MBK1868882.1 ABC transporter permease [Aestuariivirga sp. YIM B02566]